MHCPGDYDAVAGRCNRPKFWEYGIITMNSVAIDEHLCKTGDYSMGVYREWPVQVADYNVCCHVEE